MSVPAYNTTFKGVPVPDAVLDAFVRVVAITIQGLMNRTPKRILTERAVGEYIGIGMVGYGMAMIFHLDLKGPREPSFTCGPPHVASTSFRWKVEIESDREDLRLDVAFPTQKEVEETVSVFFTRPYHVQRVSDDALDKARAYVIKAVRRGEYGR